MTVREVPASIGQRVLWQMDHHRGAHGALNCPLLHRLEGPLDVAALQAAVARLALRHDALRTTFAGRGPRLKQLIHSQPLELDIAEVDLSREGDPEVALRSAVVREVQTRTDVAARPVRVTLWRLGAGRHFLCVNMHHLVTDGWSTAVVASELGSLYAHVLGGGPAPAPVGWQYPQWAAWHREQLTGETFRRLQAYWRERLSGARLPSLPRRSSDVPLSERHTAVARASLAPPVVRALRDLARSRGTALFTVMLAVYYAALQAEVDGSDLAIGSIFANRARREAQSTIGFMSNMVVLRVRVARGAGFLELLETADDAVIGAFAHQELPFQMLPLDTIDATSMRPDAVVFQLLAGPMARVQRARVEFIPVIDVPDGIGSRWELELSLAPEGDGLAVLLCYAEDLYDREWARGFLAEYVSLASALAREDARGIASLSAASRS